jgi:hypothetical protein
MIGQWLGKYEGGTSGDLMINIDQVDLHFEGVAYITPYDGDIPISIAYITTEDTGTEHTTTAYIFPVHPRTGYQCKWDEIKHLYPDDVVHSTEATILIKIVDEQLLIEANSDIDIKLISTLSKPSDIPKSKIEGTVKTWVQFKNYLAELSKSQCLFRGQKDQWRLRTSFHRNGRYRINEFANKDVKQLHKKLSAITKHYFDLDSPEQNGSFFNLLQHHGYPTPLLDWTYSPFVSAFFAFRDLPRNYAGNGFVRIYIFDNDAWVKKYSQVQNLNPPYPHLSVMEFIAIDNPRLVPQQAVTTVTNVDDIEAYLLEKSTKDETDYLIAIDIAANERENVMRDLRFMGITAGSMFPSIDGVCEEIRELNF